MPQSNDPKPGLNPGFVVTPLAAPNRFRMPGLLSTMMTVPKMQKAPYRIAVIRFEKEGERLPRKPGAVTVLTIDAGKISSVDFARDAQQIRNHLK